MCLLIIAHGVDPRYPLVLAANRDEFHARPTAPSAFWPEHPALLAGRDLEAGGTWMGITRNGRFAAITNYRDPSRTLPAPRSRGELPVNFLCADNSPEVFLQELLPHADHYAGFNLLVGTPGNLWYFTNSLPADERAPVCLRPGIYGLSNAQLDTPWPKVVMGKQKIEALLQTARLNHPGVVAVVGDRLPADLPALHQQGLNGEMDQLLSAQFISAGTYGTRSSTSLWTDSDGLIHWCELSFDTGGQEVARTEEVFPMAAS